MRIKSKLTVPSYLHFLILTFVIYLQTQAIFAEEKTNESFLSNTNIEIAKKADFVQAGTVEAMILTPSYIPKTNAGNYFTPLSKNQRDKILEYMEKSPKIDVNTRTSTCVFKPGLSFTYSNYKDLGFKNKDGTSVKGESPALRVLLCFNCDLWAVAASSSYFKEEIAPKDVIIFGDSRPFRKELEALQRELKPVIPDPSIFSGTTSAEELKHN